MNLLRDQFLRVRLQDGSIRPASILEIGDPSFCDILVPRPDFRGALFHLLIGLLQAFLAPGTLAAWKTLSGKPPTRAELEQNLAPYFHAFELTAEGPAFMQDLDLLADAKPTPIAALLIEEPGENTVKKNLDHFIHDGRVGLMCRRCAATALFTLQTNAPAGGAGHRVSLRGGGPLTTLLVPDEPNPTLWQRLWINVIPADTLGYPPIKELSSVLPWLAPTRTSDPKGIGITTPEDVHPLQAYWSMPRRIRLDVHYVAAGHCSLCGEFDEFLIRQYRTKNYGTNYGGAWVHPLTPYNIEPGELPLSLKGQRARGGYRDWLGLTLGSDDGKPTAAAVVDNLARNHPKFRARLWCFGYAMDNMKALCWYDSTLPLHNVEAAHQKPFRKAVRDLIEVATESAALLNKYVKAARFSRPGDAASDPAVALSFWQRSEPRFYLQLERLSKLDFQEDEAALAAVYRSWLQEVRVTALDLFNEWVQSTPIEDADMRRVVQAQADLAKWLNNSKPMKSLRQLVKAHSQEDHA